MPSEPEYEQTREHSVSQKRIENREQRRDKNRAAKTAPPSIRAINPLLILASRDSGMKSADIFGRTITQI
jgi:hypothetical protein